MTETARRLAFLTIPRDPIQTRIHTLENGLRLFMTVNGEEPRVQTEIAVRAGSKHDPADATGLAHYFEHMMFKGTDRLGALDWPTEKVMLDRIEQLFEDHRNTDDPERKRLIYSEIDKLSGQAARFVAANEYDKMVSALGAKGTNAYTWVEQTVYLNDIPSNELGRWFELEAERFRRPVLRVFHTELETIFEEFNMNQDKDFRKVLNAVNGALYPLHQYGTQTTIGRAEDLKNPSQRLVYDFFDKYYVPNNMAVILAGDFDPEAAVELAERTFGQFKSKPIPRFSFKKQPEITAPIRREVVGPEAEWVEISWRFPGATSREAMLLPLISGIFYNQQAGLIDLNLRQKQLVLEAYAYQRGYEDFSQFGLSGKPREGQTLEQVEQLLLEQVEKLRAGDFEDWLPQAVVKDMKLAEIRHFEKNQGRADSLTSAFILGVDWKEVVGRWKKLEKIGKAEVVEFATKWLRPENFVVVYKRTGHDPNVLKLEKPPLTAIELNRTDSSDFARDFLSIETPEIEPQFVDFQKVIKRKSLAGGIHFDAIRQPESKLFRLHFLYEMGRNAERRLGLLASYLPFLGMADLTATQVQQQFFRLGIHFQAECQEERFFLSLTGLEESFEPAIALMMRLLSEAQPNADALQNLVEDVFLKRENSKKDKSTIVRKGLANWAKHGPVSSFTEVLSREKLLSTTADELTALARQLNDFEKTIYYLGPKTAGRAAEILKKYLPESASNPQPVPMNKVYPELKTGKNRVFFVDFPSVQVELMLLSKGSPMFNLDEFCLAEWYNHYFGYGLSSIVFQEIRESKALAYSAYAYASSPGKKRRAHWLQAYVGTQPDKLETAVNAFREILETMPLSPKQAENARISILKQMAAERMKPENIYWNWLTTRERGFKNDLRKQVNERLLDAELLDLIEFQRKHIKGRAFTWLVLGERSRIDFKFLKKIGPVEELSLEQIFGY